MSTREPSFSFEFFPPPPDLVRHLNSLYILKFAPGLNEEMMPAYSAQLMVSDGPAGLADFGAGPIYSHRFASMLGPLTHACKISMVGPTTIYGVSFSYYGWAAIARLPVAKFGDQHIDAVTGLGEDAGQAAIALGKASGQYTPTEMLERLANVIRMRVQDLPDGHARLIDTTYAWLQSSFNPAMEVLYEKVPYSQRQTQRLVKQFFGLAPQRLKRRYRAIHAAAMLADPNLDEASRTEICDAFYDQAHMIREIRTFTGRTPRVLAPGQLSFASATLAAEAPYQAADFISANDSQQADLG